MRREETTGESPRENSLPEITQRNVERIAQLEQRANAGRTRWDHLADVATSLIGSWTFLTIQSVLLALWMGVNLAAGHLRWDPYPFVLLNLVLSFQAAFATPIILMSQNRQAKLSERRNELDLQINLLTEQENTEQLRLLRKLCETLQISVDDAQENALEEPAQPDTIVEQIVRTMDSPRG